MRRFSILGMMGLVLALAVAIAALRNADDYWAGGLLLSTCLLVGVATLGGLFGAGRSRPGRLGFAIFAGGYFALAFLGLSEVNLTKLPTTWLLTFVHQRVSPPTFTITYSGTTASPMGQGLVVTSNVVAAPMANMVMTTTTSQVPLMFAPSSGWKSLFPGAANYESFSVVGHCLFALLAGWLGAIIARRTSARREARERAEISDEAAESPIVL